MKIFTPLYVVHVFISILKTGKLRFRDYVINQRSQSKDGVQMDPTSRNWDPNNDSCPSVSHVRAGAVACQAAPLEGRVLREWQIRRENV